MNMIRKATLDDYDVIKHFEEELLKIHRERRPDIFDDGDPLHYDMYRSQLNDKRFIILVYEEDEVVGYICASLFEYRNALLKPIRGYHISDLFVEEKRRRNGIGRELIKALKEKAKAEGIDRIELMVWTFNKEALAFYEKLGFSCKNYTLEQLL